MKNLSVGLNEVFDEVAKYLKKAYPNCCGLKLTYLELADFDDEIVFRGEVIYNENKDAEITEAIFQANPDGTITYFQEGHRW